MWHLNAPQCSIHDRPLHCREAAGFPDFVNGCFYLGRLPAQICQHTLKAAEIVEHHVQRRFYTFCHIHNACCAVLFQHYFINHADQLEDVCLFFRIYLQHSLGFLFVSVELRKFLGNKYLVYIPIRICNERIIIRCFQRRQRGMFDRNTIGAVFNLTACHGLF